MPARSKKLFPSAFLCASAFGGSSDTLGEAYPNYCVKNTFIDVVDAPSPMALRRSQTMDRNFGRLNYGRTRTLSDVSTCESRDAKNLSPAGSDCDSDIVVSVKNTFLHAESKSKTCFSENRPRRRTAPVPETPETVSEPTLFESTPTSSQNGTPRFLLHFPPPPPGSAPELPWSVFLPSVSPSFSSAPEIVINSPHASAVSSPALFSSHQASPHAAFLTPARTHSSPAFRNSDGTNPTRSAPKALQDWRLRLQEAAARALNISNFDLDKSPVVPEKQLLVHIEPKKWWAGGAERETLSLVSRSGEVWGSLNMQSSRRVDDWERNSRKDSITDGSSEKVGITLLEVPEGEGSAGGLAKLGVKAIQQMSRARDAKNGGWQSKMVWMVPTRILNGKATFEDYKIRAVLKSSAQARKEDKDTRNKKRAQLNSSGELF